MQIIIKTFCIFGFIQIVLCACDQPERHRPHNRGQGHRRNHENRRLLTPVYPGSPNEDENSIQIPVSIVRDPAQIDVADLRISQNELCQEPDKRYHNETSKCFIPGSNDHPCGQMMEFLEDNDNKKYGYCDCKKSDGCDYRPIVHWPPLERCYHLHEQGPCGVDEWLAFDEATQVVKCLVRPCPPNPTEPSDKNKIWFSKDGTCFQLGTQAFCDDPNESVYYTDENLGETGVLKCSTTPITRPCINIGTKAIIVSGTIECAPGAKKNSAGGCSSVVAI